MYIITKSTYVTTSNPIHAIKLNKFKIANILLIMENKNISPKILQLIASDQISYTRNSI